MQSPACDKSPRGSDLCRGVIRALETLGQGFLRHPESRALRRALASYALSPTVYLEELLWIVYRILFVLFAEERQLLLAPSASEQARCLYASEYGLGRLRNFPIEDPGEAPALDLWERVSIVFDGLAIGDERLGLPPLGGPFTRQPRPEIALAKLDSRVLLRAMQSLSFPGEGEERSQWDFGAMPVETMGSLHESLLGLRLQIKGDGSSITFEEPHKNKNNPRKRTGSYYTPSRLVETLLDSALSPVVEGVIAEHPDKVDEALLDITVVDPACGSGHFLVAAARRLAVRIAREREGVSPSLEGTQRALRQVIERCLYGVDLDPLAAALCRIRLWLEVGNPGYPFSALEAHIRHGNALLGATPELLDKGIPDIAWTAIEGDDKRVARALRKRNKQAQSKRPARARPPSATEDEHDQLVSNTWCASFVWPKRKGRLADAAPTDALWRQIRERTRVPSDLTRETARSLAEQYRFFHWHLVFPEIFAKGGFDVVVGNPPWERTKLHEREWFASAPDIALARTKAERALLIRRLERASPAQFLAYKEAVRASQGETAVLAGSGLYPLGAIGDTNTYPLFLELGIRLLAPRGRIGMIVKTGLLADYSLRLMLRFLVDNGRLVSAFDFSNRKQIFPDVVANERFTLLTLSGAKSAERAPQLATLCESIEDLGEPGRIWELCPEDIAKINPNTRTCPLFQHQRDAELVRAIYERVPVFVKESPPAENPWSVHYYRMFDMTIDSGLFRDTEQLAGRPGSEGAYLPLLEGKLIDQHDHRHGTFRGVPREARFGVKAEPSHLSDEERRSADARGLPRYWVPKRLVLERYEKKLGYYPGGVLSFRDVCRTHTDLRTVRAAICPPFGAGNKAPLLLFPGQNRQEHAKRSLFLCANLNAIVLDYVARRKFAGGSLNRYILFQLPILPPQLLLAKGPGSHGADLPKLIVQNALELSYTDHDLEGLARDLGALGPPFQWDPERRFRLRAELDAAFFHLYGVSRADAEAIFDTFPILRKSEEKRYGVYRSREAILRAYDAMTVQGSAR